jgi:hypothetical protein
VTSSSATRRERRRERKEHRRKRDQAAIDLSAALQVAWKLSGRQANDLAIAWLEGREIEPTKQPRGSKRRGPASILVGYEHVLRTSFAGRDATLRQKVKRGGAAPHPGVVLALVLMLRENADTARRIARQILALPEAEARQAALRLLK